MAIKLVLPKVEKGVGRRCESFVLQGRKGGKGLSTGYPVEEDFDEPGVDC